MSHGQAAAAEAALLLLPRLERRRVRVVPEVCVSLYAHTYVSVSTSVYIGTDVSMSVYIGTDVSLLHASSTGPPRSRARKSAI